jgi:protein TonB
MITHLPVALVAHASARGDPATNPRPTLDPTTGDWKYRASPTPRVLVAAAVLVSAGLHAALLLGIGPPRKRVASAAPVDSEKIIRLAIPELKELEEPEPVPTEENAQPVDLSVIVPMQADVPGLPQPNDFVQQLNFASLLEKPDFSNVKVYVIPEHMRSGTRLADQIGKIFNISDLDRVPEAILQPSPQFPFAMRREANTGTVMVEFIVDVNGVVLDPMVRDSTHHGFDEAALAGVSRWKFKPGFKAGRKVNTRMRVPIIFKYTDSID